jgi:poly(A) polymerase
LWSILLKEPLDEACAGERDKVRAAGDFLEPVVARVAVPRRISDGVRRIAAILPRLAAGRSGRFGRTELMTSALDVLDADLQSSGKSTTPVERMRAAFSQAPQAPSHQFAPSRRR